MRDGGDKVLPLPEWTRRLFMAFCACVIVVLVVLLFRNIHDAHELSVAQGECETIGKQFTTFESDARRSDATGEVKQTKAIDATQVADSKTVEDLHVKLDAFSKKSPKTVVCTLSDAGAIRQNTAKLRESWKARREAQSAIVRAARVVVASRDAKSLADAKSSLAKAVKAALGTLDSSHGRVADNKTRETLQKSLDAANKVLADKGVKDPKKYRDAQATLAAPVKGVNDSVAAKAAADKAAADKAAAAAQAAAQAQAQSRSSAG
ncbi:hypothetical protein, partial [Bifidobacterium aquikefiri]|uniref:hypothetical protein n=1 Tax=Bifidobacterium aquikefiri TaxID=1653207 RepID=UPI0039ED9776